KALEIASFAANRAAKNGAGSRCEREYAISAARSIRFKNLSPNFSWEARMRATSMMSMPTPKIIFQSWFFFCRVKNSETHAEIATRDTISRTEDERAVSGRSD